MLYFILNIILSVCRFRRRFFFIFWYFRISRLKKLITPFIVILGVLYFSNNEYALLPKQVMWGFVSRELVYIFGCLNVRTTVDKIQTSWNPWIFRLPKLFLAHKIVNHLAALVQVFCKIYKTKAGENGDTMKWKDDKYDERKFNRQIEIGTMMRDISSN